MVYNFITMIEWLIKKLLGTKSDREVKRLRKVVQRITQREAGLIKLTREGYFKGGELVVCTLTGVLLLFLCLSL